MSDNFKLNGKKQSTSLEASRQRPKRAYETTKQTYAVSEDGKKTACPVDTLDSHKIPLMHIGVNPPSSDPPPSSPGKKKPTNSKVVIVYKTGRRKNTTKVANRSACSKGTRKFEQGRRVNNKYGGIWRKK